MEQIQVKFSEIQNLEANGDTKGANKLRAELRDLAPGVRPEKHFFASLERILTDEQKATLPKLLQEVKGAPDPSRPTQPPPPRPQPPKLVEPPQRPTERTKPPQPTPEPPAPPAAAAELRPVHVLTAVLEVGLKPDQRRQVEEALGDFRAEQAKNRPLNPTERATRVERLVQALRPLLNAAQTKQFDENVAALHKNVPQAKTIKLPGASQQPAARPGPPPRPRPTPPNKE